MMTVKEVKARIEEIIKVSEDDERAHGLEDQLWEQVLEELSATNPIAEEALKTRRISFARWCG